MSPGTGFVKHCSENDLRQHKDGGCAYSCASFAIDHDLACFIAAWPSLQSSQRQALLTLVQTQNDAKGQTTLNNAPQPEGGVILPRTPISDKPARFDSSSGLPNTTPLTPHAGLFSEPEWQNLVDRLSLSERQTEILHLLLDGENDKQIARKLGISLPTLRTHLQRMYVRFNVSNRTSLIVELFRIIRTSA